MRRIKTPHLHHPAYFRASRNAKIVAILQDLWGSVRFDTGKLNMKSAGYGAPVEWHQDWAFYPHTNDDLAAVGIMLDDVDLENGPMMVMPGSHRGPIHDHHARTAGSAARWTRPRCDIDLSRALPCLGKAGSITVHHVRAVHGSATNFSGRERRFLLYQYRAADAWPLLGLTDGIEKFDELLLAGEPSLAPRLADGAGAPAVAAGRAPGLDLREPARQRPALFRDRRRAARRGGITPARLPPASCGGWKSALRTGPRPGCGHAPGGTPCR